MKKPRTLAMLCLSGSFGGLEMNTVRLARWLKDLNLFDVTVIGLEKSPAVQMAKEAGLPVACTKSCAKYMDIRGSYRLRKMLRSMGVEVVFTANNRDLSLLSALKNIWRSPVKVVYQQQMDLVINKKDIIHTLRFSAIDLWIAPLESIKHDAMRHTRVKASKIKVIPLGVEVEPLLAGKKDSLSAQKQLGLKSKHPLIGIMGRIDRLKGQLVLLQALQILREKNIFAALLIAGEPTRNTGQGYTEELQNFVRANRLGDAVHFCPFMCDVATFYSAVDVFVMATKRETYGMVTAEAMLFGLPVVGSNAGGTVELLSLYDGYLLFEPENANDLAGKLQQILENPEEYKAKARQASARVKRYFSHVEECKAIQAAIEALMTKR
ncbi:MAG: glycosyltransferase family 4 protein [Prevotellaceae bacterium]|nr:glycosyltransferase family 4 protein [Prevotellaceae bacterium]